MAQCNDGTISRTAATAEAVRGGNYGKVGDKGNRQETVGLAVVVQAGCQCRT